VHRVKTFYSCRSLRFDLNDTAVGGSSVKAKVLISRWLTDNQSLVRISLIKRSENTRLGFVCGFERASERWINAIILNGSYQSNRMRRHDVIVPTIVTYKQSAANFVT